MKKGFKIFYIIWLLTFIGFNCICFLTPSEIEGETILEIILLLASFNGLTIDEVVNISRLPIECVTYYKFGGAFWIGYAGIVVAFIGQLICLIIASKEDNKQKMFYKMSIVTTSYIGLILTTIVSAVCMLYPDMTIKTGALICILILLVTLISVLKASAVTSIVSEKDDEIKNKTNYIKNLTSTFELKYKNETDKTKKEELKKVYEALRYSDPMSNESVREIEYNINNNLDNTEQLLKLIKERNEVLRNNK